MKWDLNNKKIDFFTLDELEDKKEGVLLLNSLYFKIIPLTLSKELDERERELEIEERLEDIIEEYDNFYFIDKEITLFENEEIEKIILMMIEKDKIYTLIENMSEKGIKLLGVYPLFFVEFFNKDNLAKSYIEIGEDLSRIYTFKENKLVDFQELEMEKTEILSNSNYIEEYFLERYKKFVYLEEKYITEYIPNIEVMNWKEYKLYLKEEYDYLPKEYHREIVYKKVVKIVIFILSIVVIIGVILFFFFQFLINKEVEKINLVQSEYREKKEKNLDLREKIKDLEERITITREKNREREFNSIKLSEILSKILNKPYNIDFYKIEYDGKNILNLEGSAGSEEDIYSFQKEILKVRYFKKLNQDYIRLEDNYYRFHMDIEVSNEID